MIKHLAVLNVLSATLIVVAGCTQGGPAQPTQTAAVPADVPALSKLNGAWEGTGDGKGITAHIDIAADGTPDLVYQYPGESATKLDCHADGKSVVCVHPNNRVSKFTAREDGKVDFWSQNPQNGRIYTNVMAAQ
jgi:hypothetical protein